MFNATWLHVLTANLVLILFQCDGCKPKCLNCELYHDECTFVFHNDKRKPYPKEYIDALTSRISILENLLTKANIDHSNIQPDTVKQPSEDTSNANLATAAAAKLVEPTRSTNDYVDRLTDRVGQLSMTNIGLRYYGPTSNLHLLSSIIWTRRPNSNIEFKGRAAVDAAGLSYNVDPVRRDHLLNLYWTWQHPFFNVVKKSIFLRDMHLYETGRASQAKYYSPLLLNAILALAALLDDEYDEGEAFHLKARVLIDIEVEDPRITTIQASAILGLFEGVCDRDTRGWIYTGMSIRMAVDMGIHLNCDCWVEKNIISKEEADMRKFTFWGCFVLDRLWSFYMGRPASIRLGDVSLDRPAEQDATPEEDNEPWVPYVSRNVPLKPIWNEFTAPSRLNLTMVYLVKLTEMIAEIQETMYSGAEGLRPDLWSFASKMHVNLTNWYTTLPSPLLCSANSQRPVISHIVVLHLQYHASLILLHRPFLKIQGANVTPNHAKDVCRTAATNITNLVEKYRLSWYSMRRINTMSVHIIFTAATVHLLNAWCDIGTYKSNATQGLKTCCLALSELGQTYETAKRTLAVLTCLINKGKADHTQNMATARNNSISQPQATNCGSNISGTPAYTRNQHHNKTSVIDDVSLPGFIGSSAASAWKPEIQRTRPFRSNLHIPVQDNESVSLLFPNNSILQIAPPKWEPLRNPTTALRESEGDELHESEDKNYALIHDLYGEPEDLKDPELMAAATTLNHGTMEGAISANNDGSTNGGVDNTIYDNLMQTTSGRLPVNSSAAAAAGATDSEVLDDLPEGLPRNWSSYIQSVKTDNFN